MNPPVIRPLRQGFPLAVFIAILAFVILISVILMSLRSILAKRDSEESLRFGYEPVMLPMLLESGSLPHNGTISGDDVFQLDFGRSILMAERASHDGNFARAEDILRSVLLFFPGSPTAEKMLANVFYSTGRYADAERIYQTILNRDPSDIVSLNNCAMAQGMQGNFADAIENMKKVLEMDPESVTADLNLAGLYSRANNRPLARKHFDSARKKLGGNIRNLSFDPCLRELLMESDLRDQIDPDAADIPDAVREKGITP